jgi:hypothetical protein
MKKALSLIFMFFIFLFAGIIISTILYSAYLGILNYVVGLKLPVFEVSTITNAFFYFDANRFLDKMKNNSIWQAGHTHDSSKKIYSRKTGIFKKKVKLLVNPVGYPFETKNKFSLKSRCQDFLLWL